MEKERPAINRVEQSNPTGIRGRMDVFVKIALDGCLDML